MQEHTQLPPPCPGPSTFTARSRCDSPSVHSHEASILQTRTLFGKGACHSVQSQIKSSSGRTGSPKRSAKDGRIIKQGTRVL